MILETASRHLLEVGMENFSLNQIAAQAGISLGNLQHYFPHKKDLIVGLLEEQMGPVEDMIRESENATEPNDQLLEQSLRYALELNGVDESCVLVWSMASMAFYDKDVKKLTDYWFELYQRNLSIMLSRHQPALSRTQIKYLSISIMSMIEGHALIWRYLTPGARERVTARETLLEDIMSLVDKRSNA